MGSAQATSPAAEPRRVLLVDDDESVTRFLSTTLGASGYQVDVANSVLDARTKLFARHYPLLVVDWALPDTPGLELVRQLRAVREGPYTFCLMLTARTGTRAFLEGMDAGADDFLSKPVDLDVLRARLKVAERMLALQGELSQLRELVPICSYCRKLRADDGTWQPLEQYLHERSHRVTHGVCEECSKAVLAGRTPGRD